MRELRLSEVRCFYHPGPARLARLTVLVGENSTGKSSFLALLRIIWELMAGNPTPSFNAEPFFLGAYDQIAHFRGGRGGRSKTFSLQLSADIQANIPAEEGTGTARFVAQFAKSGSQPRLSKLSFSCGRYGFEYTIADVAKGTEPPKISVLFRVPSLDKPLVVTEGIPPLMSGDIFRSQTFGWWWPVVMLNSLPRQPEGPSATISRDEVRYLELLWHALSTAFGARPFAIAPVRTKPERTYNPIDDTPRSEGSHVPMILAKTFFTDKGKWQKLKVALDKFGAASGLFEEISLRPLGRSDSDPFQILIKISGPPSNLMDVGYGVSQVLPILVDLINSDRPRTYLLQQPEVHLHPRAQAELATFFANFVRETPNWIVMETHSDYMIDRLRVEVRRKTIRPEDVSIVYFSRVGRESYIRNIGLDERGNLTEVPFGYRQFFLKEEELLLGIDG